MNVKNRKCIRKLSLKSLYANRRRNLIAIFCHCADNAAIYVHVHHCLVTERQHETYQFRQVGSYAHGTFKDVSPSRRNASLPTQR